MTGQVRAIVWAQWRSLVNYFPHSNLAVSAVSAGLSAVWYGGCVVFAVLLAQVFSEPANAGLTESVLPPGLLLGFLFWQIVPVLLATTGGSLSMRKLLVYPVEPSRLFGVELALRAATTSEMTIVLTGVSVGLALNPRLPKWGPLALAGFAAFNICLSAGTRDFMVRIFERKRLREIAGLLIVMVGAIPQLIIAMGYGEKVAGLFRGGPGAPVWPWSAAALLCGERPSLAAAAVLAAWTAAGYAFGRFQHARTLRFDAEEANASESPVAAPRRGIAERLSAWPNRILRDPLAALVEKEIRFLVRAPRFRLVFIMGFTFGLVIWLPMAAGHARGGVVGSNFLTFTSLYSLLLLGDVCFWNVFGFDRLAAQLYWAMPAPFSTVLIGKNLTALFFVLLEVTLIAIGCAVIRAPLDAVRIAEAYAATVTTALYVMALGNLTSTTNARPLNASRAMRSGAPGKLQALMLLLYPVASIPVLLAFGARYAFSGEWAFFAALAASGAIGAVVYRVSLESALEAAEKNKEKLLAALGQGEGVMQA